MDPLNERIQALTRRHFFGRGALGLGTAALAALSAVRSGSAAVAAKGGLPGLPHFTPKAKRAIYLFMNGGPSQMDLFDYKPKLADLFAKELPDSVRQGQVAGASLGRTTYPVAPSRFEFRQHGRSGAWVSEVLPWTAKVVDELAIIKSVHTDAVNHDPAVTLICTGHQIPGRPSLGAWLSYGLGTENQNLPAFVVIAASMPGPLSAQPLYNRLWGSGFLSSRHQGVSLRSAGDPVLFLSNPPGVPITSRRHMLDALAHLNQKQFEAVGDPETQTRIAQYEMAFRMQSSVPELTDVSGEPKSVLDLYGPNVQKPGTFAASCLLARRLAERDVRYVQVFHRDWDHHGNMKSGLTLQCRDVDQPCYALITDLKQRGLLDDTLVIWGGEFGRTVYCQGELTRENYGRDHHPRCFSVWMAGGGVKPGIVYGETDDFSFNVVENPVHIHDLNATILHCLGIDHRRLSYKYQGVDMRLTGFEERQPVRGILA